MSDFIVDASVVAKWFVSEPDSLDAESLIQNHYLRAPDLLLPELASVLWKKVRRKEMTVEGLQIALDVFLDHHVDVTVRPLPSRIVAKNASRIAHSEGCSIYDSLYLALAVQSGCNLVTADERFIRSLRSPALQRHIVSLSSLKLS